MVRVFLGGTCNGSTWRDRLIEMIKLEYFNPVVEVWDDAARENEAREHKRCTVKLYVLTPKMKGCYGVAEAVRDAVLRPRQTIVCVLAKDDEDLFDDDQIESLFATLEMCSNFGVSVFRDLDELAEKLNSLYVEPPPFDPYMVECLIDRDGPTEIYMDGERYFFEKNELGDYVCSVQRNDHRKRFKELEDFRIYREDKLPPPEFTEDELEFMREWRTMDKESFQAYVNNRMHRFHSARLRVRRIAVTKWEALHHRDEKPMPCPITLGDVQGDDPIADLSGAPMQGQPPAPAVDDSINWTDEQWEQWKNLWLRLNAERFARFLKENENKFLHSPDDLWARAQEKWQKLMPDTPWPFVGDDDDEDNEGDE